MHLSEIILNTLLFITLYVQVLLLFTFLEKKSEKIEKTGDVRNNNTVAAKTASYSYFPTVSIIVPCWNEEKTLAGTVRSLLALDYPKDKLKILIVDDGSTDNTLAVAKSFRGDAQVRVFHKANGGKHTAMNLGLSHADSELVGGLDADSFVKKNALLEIVREFENPRVMAVTPAIRVHEPSNILQALQRVEYNMGVFLRKMFGHMNAISVTPGPFSIFRKKVFKDLGKYKKAHNTEDMEYALRMHKHYYPITNAHAAFVYTVTPKTVRALVKQRLRWVYGFLMNMYDYRELLFKKKYGNLGLFSLPAAVISIFTVIYYTISALLNAWEKISDKIIEYSIIGFHFPEFSRLINADWWFFWNTNMTNVLVYALLACATIIVLLGQSIAEGKIKIHPGLFYFFLFYGLLAPIWIFRAVFNVIFIRKNSWR